MTEDRRPPRRRPAVRWTALAPLLLYAGLALLLTWPLARDLDSKLGAPEGPGDPYLNLWILGWDLHTLTSDPTAVVDGRVFDANIFHPAAETLTYSDHLLLQAAMVLPLYLVGRDPVVCYNALLLLSFVLNGLSMHWCARGFGAGLAGAYVAGIAWAYWPYHFSHLIHLQLQALYFLPLALLFLSRVLAAGRSRDAALCGAFAGLQALSAFYYGVLTMVALGVHAAIVAVGTGRWRRPALWGRLALAVLVGVVVVAPVVWPYWRMQREEGFARNLYEASRHAAVPASYLQVPESNVLYGRTRLMTARDGVGRLRPGRVEGVEQSLFPGVVLALFAGIGFWTARRTATWPVSASLSAMIVVGVVLSLGPDGVRSVYALFHRWVFGFQAVRAPARFGVLVVLGLSLLAARGVGGWHRSGRLAGLFLLLPILEYLSVPLALVDRPPLETSTGRWLATVEGPGAVAYLPLTNDRRNTIGMVDSLQHWRPVLNGYSGQRPSFFPALVDTLATFPSADALWTLKDFGVRFLVTHEPLPVGPWPVVERASFGDVRIYEVVWTPEAEAALALPSTPAPPPPGPMPFAVGERAVYDVMWLGGPMNVPAGRATLEVQAAEGPEVRFEFVATAETAAWVSRFFEARDRFVTAADARLFPLWHERFQRQGRRAVDRRYAFDRDAGVVRIETLGAETPPVSFRIPSGTRDALTTFYYVRSLALQPGDALALPLNDGGRNRLVTLDVVARETIVVRERDQPALRIVPRITERVPRREPLSVVLWLSDDQRRIPLVTEVAAGFGRMRLELTDYER